MKLYIGGVCQGQTELAQQENPDGEYYFDFHETIRTAVVQEGQEPRAFAQRFCEAHPNAIVAANEVGAGVVPMLAEDRAFREAVGRALCVVAQNAQQVTRCMCGIGTRIK